MGSEFFDMADIFTSAKSVFRRANHHITNLNSEIVNKVIAPNFSSFLRHLYRSEDLF